MEGLIPFVYKAIKERRRRSYSRCSSASGVRPDVDGDVWEQEQKQWVVVPTRNKEDDGRFHAEAGTTAHRRHRSLEELAGEVGASPTWRPGALPRGRSIGIFSCISGM